METVAMSHQESLSPSLPHIFTTIKTEVPDFWNPPQSSAPVSVAENYSTYTPLETFHPDSSYTQYLNAVNGVSPYGLPTLLSFSGPSEEPDTTPTYGTNLYRTQDAMFYQRDEGIGSSPSSHSASPSSLVHEQQGRVSNGHYADGQNERSSPGDSAYSEEIAPNRVLDLQPQCVKCGIAGSDLWWRDATGHYLCRHCCQGSGQTTVQPEEDPLLLEKRRKRSTCTAKKDNQTCTNCGSRSTTLWRRNMNGEVVCNACGLYEKLHKCPRPMSMKKDTIQTRKRKPRSSGSRRKSSAEASEVLAKKGHCLTPVSSAYQYSSLHMNDPLPDMQSAMQECHLLPSMNSSTPYYKQEIPNPYHLVPTSVITLADMPTRLLATPPVNT